MATHSSVLAWRIPGAREPVGLPSMGSHRVGHNRSDLAAATLHCNFTCLGQPEGFAVFTEKSHFGLVPVLAPKVNSSQLTWEDTQIKFT